MASQPDWWLKSPNSMPRSRFGEYTAESLREHFTGFSAPAIAELTSFPTLFAYEHPANQAARLGRITRIAQPSGADIRFHFELFEGVAGIPVELQARLAWELDLGRWEVNRTHWAVKDVDLIEVLTRAGNLPDGFVAPGLGLAKLPNVVPVALPILPTVFAVPTTPLDPTAVAVMMPFSPAFDDVFAAIETSSRTAGLKCTRADRVWEDSTIVQDIFNLIYRSRIVVADLTGSNPNVLYEVGIAHTLGRPVVPLAQAPVSRPFDIAHHRILEYECTDEGLARMVSKLTSRLRYLAG